MATETALQRLASIDAEAAKLDKEKVSIRAEILAELQNEISKLGFTKDELFPPQKPVKAARKPGSKTDKPAMYRDRLYAVLCGT